MRLLVTGGSGFLGRYVLADAAHRGHEVVALARSPGAVRIVAGRGAEPVSCDLDDASGVGEVFFDARCEALISLSSLGNGHGPTVVDAAEAAGIKRAVFVSSTSVTTTLDAPTKRVRLAAEEHIKASGLDWTIVRPTMIYGATDDRNLARLLTLLIRTQTLPVPCASRLHQPVHVADVAAAVLAAAERPESAGRSYDVAGPIPLRFAELLRQSAAAVGRSVRLVPVPLFPLVALASACERFAARLPIKAEQLMRLGEDKMFAIDAAARDLDYAPRSFAEGIRAQAKAMGLVR